jgi:hypothetical protein
VTRSTISDAWSPLSSELSVGRWTLDVFFVPL